MDSDSSDASQHQQQELSQLRVGLLQRALLRGGAGSVSDDAASDEEQLTLREALHSTDSLMMGANDSRTQPDTSMIRVSISTYFAQGDFEMHIILVKM